MDTNHIKRELKLAAREMQGYFEFPPEFKRLERKFESAIQDILSGISDYKDVMETFSRFRRYPDAVEIGKRGVDTARKRYESWRAIADDLYALAGKMENRERETGSYAVD